MQPGRQILFGDPQFIAGILSQIPDLFGQIKNLSGRLYNMLNISFSI